MADEGDLVAVFVLGFVVLSYAILFYLCDKEYRNNFGLTIEDVTTVDTVAITVEKAKDQFNQMALRFDKLKVCKKKLLCMIKGAKVLRQCSQCTCTVCFFVPPYPRRFEAQICS